MEESREVNSAFPDALKEPILRRIQFSTVSRVDNLGRFILGRYLRHFVKANMRMLVDEIYEVTTWLGIGLPVLNSLTRNRNLSRIFTPENLS